MTRNPSAPFALERYRDATAAAGKTTRSRGFVMTRVIHVAHHLAAGLLLLGGLALPAAGAAAGPSAPQPFGTFGPCEAPAAAERSEVRASQDAGSPARFRHVQLPTGVRIRFVERGAPDGEPVILLHGYTDSWFSFSRVLPLLPQEYRVFAIDQRGHGCSTRPEAGYGMADLAADVIAFMDAQGLARATIVGHSMGSLVAQQVALAAPQRVARLVLVGSATAPSRVPGLIEFEAVVDALSDPVPADFVREFQLSTVHQSLPETFIDRVVGESLRLPARIWRALMDGMLAMEPAAGLGALRIPTLILWGERDSVFPRSEQDALLAALPHATLEVYPETGHAPHWERPERFARDLLRFLRTRPDPTFAPLGRAAGTGEPGTGPLQADAFP